jgi:hypothetical protein
VEEEGISRVTKGGKSLHRSTEEEEEEDWDMTYRVETKDKKDHCTRSVWSCEGGQSTDDTLHRQNADRRMKGSLGDELGECVANDDGRSKGRSGKRDF